MTVFSVNTEILLFIAAVLLLLSVIASKVSDRLGVPTLLMFLVMGMLAGSEGIGGIYFNDPALAKSLGVTALIFILFAGGLETNFQDIRPVLGRGIVLSTLGVLLTALLVAVFAKFVLHFSFLEGVLLGSIVSSTDAATVLTVLRSKRVSLKGRLRPLLEFESGSNDPMSVFLTLGSIRLLSEPGYSPANLLPAFLLEMGIGIGMAVAMSRLVLLIIDRLQLEYEGLYPVLTIALAIFTYALTTLLKGNGFLAVYVLALILGNKHFLHKKILMQFHEGFAWLMQIVMFLTLGLLVFPSKIPPVIGVGLLISVFLILVARPVSVLVCLLFSRMKINERLMLSWVGLRGAVPIILATFPLIADIPNADILFHIVFFIVLTSILFQGTSIPAVAKLLRVDAPFKKKTNYPIQFERTEAIDADLEDVIVPYDSPVVGKKIFQAGMPPRCLVILLCRDEKYFIPVGSTVLEGGDVLLVLSNREDIGRMNAVLTQKK